MDLGLKILSQDIIAKLMTTWLLITKERIYSFLSTTTLLSPFLSRENFKLIVSAKGTKLHVNSGTRC